MIKRASQTPTTAGFPSIFAFPITMASFRFVFSLAASTFRNLENPEDWKMAFLYSIPQSSYIGKHFDPAVSMNTEVAAAFGAYIVIVLYVFHIRSAARIYYICAIKPSGMDGSSPSWLTGLYLVSIFVYVFLNMLRSIRQLPFCIILIQDHKYPSGTWSRRIFQIKIILCSPGNTFQ